MSDLDKILENVKDYVEANLTKKKDWKPGQIVNYAGLVYSADEYMAAVETLLSGWLALGDIGLRFEKKFPEFMGKEYDGIHRTTFVIDENGTIQDVISDVKTKAHAAQILK